MGEKIDKKIDKKTKDKYDEQRLVSYWGYKFKEKPVNSMILGLIL